MDHHGEREEKEEVIVVEEPDGPVEGPAKVVKAPRVPSWPRSTPMWRPIFHTQIGVTCAPEVGGAMRRTVRGRRALARERLHVRWVKPISTPRARIPLGR